MNHLGKFIEKKLYELSMSEREMSGKCGISHSYLNQLIKGINPRTKKKISPTLLTFEKLSKGLKISVDDLQKIARGIPEEEVFTEKEDTRLKLLETIEKKANKEGIPVGTRGDRVIPWNVWNQIKEAHELIGCLGLDPSEQGPEEWQALLKDLQLVIKLHSEKYKKSED